MYFGKYLIEKGMINENQLIDTLSYQLDQLPSLLGLIKEHQFLEINQILSVIEKQIALKADLLTVVRKESLLTEEQISELFLLQDRERQTLSEILIQKNFITLEKLEVAVNEYVEVKKLAPEVKEDEKKCEEITKIEVKESSDEGEVSAAALESLKELGIGEGEEIAELEAKVAPANGPVIESTNSSEDDGEISSAALESLKELGISDSEELKDLESKVSSVQEVKPNDADEVEVNSAALESLKELGISDKEELESLESKTNSSPTNQDLSEGTSDEDGAKLNDTFLEQLLTTFDDHMYKRLNKIVVIIDDTAKSDGDIANFFNSLYRDFHVIKGVARLCEAIKLEELINKWELVIESIFNNSNEDNKKWVEENLASLKETVALMWDMRESIAQTSSEDSFLNDQNNKENYEKLCKVA